MHAVKGCVKFFAAGVVAVVILCIIFSFYSVLPAHITNISGNTDYVWSANAIWVKMTEGISWGRVDANGYNNMEVVENPDILVLGSSHMEAMNVMPDEGTAYLLGQMLADSYTVYNMGISGHQFTKLCHYLPASLSLYEDIPQVVVLETGTVSIDREEIDALLTGTVEHAKTHDNGIIVSLQKLPFIRLVYQQIQWGLLDLFVPELAESADEPQKQIDVDAYNAMLSYLAQIQEEYATNIIVLYHPTEIIMEDGGVEFPEEEGLDAFRDGCEAYGITFVNMTESFERMYEESYKLPHGFVNGAAGVGHVNADGHEAMAEALAETIAKLEENGKICK